MEEEDKWRASGIIGSIVPRMRMSRPESARDNMCLNVHVNQLSFRQHQDI